MATEPDREEFHEDEQDDLARRKHLLGWMVPRLLVLTVLAIVVVVSLPYLLNWLEPTPAPPVKTCQRRDRAAAGPAPAPPITSPSPPTLIPAPAAPPLAHSRLLRLRRRQPKLAPLSRLRTRSPADRPVGNGTAASWHRLPSGRRPPSRQQGFPHGSACAEARRTGSGRLARQHWVQSGLPRERTPRRAKQLRGESFPCTDLTHHAAAVPPPLAASLRRAHQNQLFITGSTPDAVNAALKGRGTAQAVKGGVVVNPPLDLETAMSLSSSLKKDGFKVVIRRAKAAPAKAAGGSTLHVVRVGGFPDQAKAQQARGELEAKGHPGFLTQGAAR
jgi:hypothetical protein